MKTPTHYDLERAGHTFDEALEAFDRAQERYHNSGNPVSRFISGAVVKYRRMAVEDSGQHVELASELLDYEQKMLDLESQPAAESL